MLGACSSGPVIPNGTRFVVSAPKAQFFKYGPAQSFGADFVLPKGMYVILLERSFGFSRVMTEDGSAGWVSSEDIAIAPPDPRPKASLAGRRGSGSGSGSGRMYSGPRKTSNVESVPGADLFDMSDLPPPPLPENPEKAPPKFRVTEPKPK